MIDRERVIRIASGGPLRVQADENGFLAAQGLSADDEERLSGRTVRLVEFK